MPRPKTDPRYAERVAALAEQEGLKVREITLRIDAEAQRDNRTDAPSERTVRRLYDDWRDLDPEIKREHALLRWPGSFTDGTLPWEAARAALDQLRYREETGRVPPTAREAKWFWRLKQASPSLPDELANFTATELAMAEYLRIAGFSTEVHIGVQWQLAYQPWLDQEHQDQF